VGHSYRVLLTGVFTGNENQGSVRGDCNFIELYVTKDKADGTIDPYVTITNYDEPSAFISLTQTLVTLKVEDGASSGTDYISVTCDGDCPVATAPVQIKGCADETITSVSPDIWFAGKAYKTTITGTNFITKEKATKLCPVSQVSVVAPSSDVAISDVKVESDTKITATIKPDDDSDIEQATVTVDSETSTTQIIDNEIQWNNQGNNQIISGIYSTGVPEQAVVGQQIILTANPNLPASIAVTSSDWTVGGTRIAGYTANSESASVTELKDDDLKKPNITFYCVYPTDSTVTYNYCVNIPGLSADDIASKLNCGLPAKATFNVEGVTSPSIGFYNEFLAHINTLAACDGVGGGTYLVYGNVYGQPNPCPLNGTPGITFYPYGSPPNTGNMFFVQVVNSNNVKYLIGDVIKIACMDRPGLDGDYPYQGLNPTSVSDAPPQIIIPTYTTLTRTFSATMYLFWQSTSTAGSIPVPLAYIPWTFSADANLVGGTWTAGGGGAPSLNNPGQSNLSDPSQPNHGYPTWTGPAITTCRNK
jgi:hypothetical protein